MTDIRSVKDNFHGLEQIQGHFVLTCPIHDVSHLKFAISCEDIARQTCAMVLRWRFFATFLRPVFFREPRAAGFRPAS